jgi:ribosomal protein L35
LRQQCCGKERNELAAREKRTGRLETGKYLLHFFERKSRKVVRKLNARKVVSNRILFPFDTTGFNADVGEH